MNIFPYMRNHFTIFYEPNIQIFQCDEMEWLVLDHTIITYYWGNEYLFHLSLSLVP